MHLRTYQKTRIEEAKQHWSAGKRSVLLSMATGTGKTVTFSEVIRQMPARAMVLAHRDELIKQASAEIGRLTGMAVDIEMGEQKAGVGWAQTPVVVSSIQTQCSRDRMQRFTPSDFRLLIIDECHRSKADTYQRCIEHYTQNPDLVVLGVTATPYRMDGKGLGSVFEAATAPYPIVQAIPDGWLCNVRQVMKRLVSLDYSGVHTSQGDLNVKEVSEILEGAKPLMGMASHTMEACKGEPTIVFTASVNHAFSFNAKMNEWIPGCSRVVTGKTSKEDRDAAVNGYRNGDFWCLVNVGVFTEGFDAPTTKHVVMGRPTKSRGLYEQMLGRGTRPLPGIVFDHMTPEERRDAIARSDKPYLRVHDFVGNCGRHKIVTGIDIMAGADIAGRVGARNRMDVEKRETIEVDLLHQVKDAQQRAAKAEQKRRERKASEIRANVTAVYESKEVDLFSGERCPFEPMASGSAPRSSGVRMATDVQKALLANVMPERDVRGLTFDDAFLLITAYREAGPAKVPPTKKQRDLLRRFGMSWAGLTCREASQLIGMRLSRNKVMT